MDLNDHVGSPYFPERKIVLVGKTGAGKSSLANTLLGENWFNPNHKSSSGTELSQSATKKVLNKELTLIDTPGLFDTEKSEKILKDEIIKSIIDCSPGVHAFLIVLKVERYTEFEEMVVNRICEYFSDNPLRYSVVVFTHGDQLEEGTTIEKFVGQNKKLGDLVKKCGGRCHVFDSKYWKNNDDPKEDRRNSYQRMELLNTVERLLTSNNGDIYTNKMLKKIGEQIKKEEVLIRETEADDSPLLDQETKRRARYNVFQWAVLKFHLFIWGSLLKAFFGDDDEIMEICRKMEDKGKKLKEI